VEERRGKEREKEGGKERGDPFFLKKFYFYLGF
jgi:hypothetical protein